MTEFSICMLWYFFLIHYFFCNRLANFAIFFGVWRNFVFISAIAVRVSWFFFFFFFLSRDEFLDWLIHDSSLKPRFTWRILWFLFEDLRISRFSLREHFTNMTIFFSILFRDLFTEISCWIYFFVRILWFSPEIIC